MSADAAYWAAPAVVELVFRDGRTEERAFESRLLAEEFVALIPALQLAGSKATEGIAGAKVRPVGMGVN